MADLKETLKEARNITRRKPVLWVGDEIPSSFARDLDLKMIPPFKAATLCQAVAESSDRIAAIIVTPLRGNPLVGNRFLKRVRELASAEGALMIWASSGDPFPSDCAFHPDLCCLER